MNYNNIIDIDARVLRIFKSSNVFGVLAKGNSKLIQSQGMCS